MATQRMKPFQLYVPITRVDEEERIVEGVAFANEVVPGEGGIRLKREAMQDATPDYLQWGAVREMHQPSAAGTAIGVDWQDDGTATIRAKVVDDAAWKKVQERVYKGFSVGVSPSLMRGKNVEKCVWIETSLVDRPKDPGAVITTFRAEGLEDEVDVEVLDEDPIERADGEKHYDCGNPYGCCGHTTAGGAEECRAKRQASIDEEIQWLQGQIETLNSRRAELGAEIERRDPEPPVVDLTRLDTLEAGQNDMLQRFTAIEQGLAKVPELAEQVQKAVERIEAIERAPRTIQAPVRYPRAMEPDAVNALQGADDPEAVARTAMEKELADLEAQLSEESDYAKREAGVRRMMVLKMTLGQTA